MACTSYRSLRKVPVSHCDLLGGHFVVNVPYDAYQQMVFQGKYYLVRPCVDGGNSFFSNMCWISVVCPYIHPILGEEMSVGIRAFTVGYDMYTPERSVCFHHYDRPAIKYYNENEEKYSADLYPNAVKRVVGIVHLHPGLNASTWDHTDEDLYGLGGVRTPEKFYETFGIDIRKETVQAHLCKWVDAANADATMHAMFVPHLRPDSMGINYDEIDYRFKDPMPQSHDDGSGAG